MDGHLRLESGLEHDLVRDLDRDPHTTWLLPQPARIQGRGRGGPTGGLVPDLLSFTGEGLVTVWAVRPESRQNEKFIAQVEQTEAACAQFGWAHRVFAGMHPTRRSNLMWLDGYRKTLPWYADALAYLVARKGHLFTLADVLEVDGDHGHVRSAVWNAMRDGVLECDLDAVFTQSTELRLVDKGAE